MIYKNNILRQCDADKACFQGLIVTGKTIAITKARGIRTE